jgi:uncharacterized protein YjbI with pentapeptide repeats
MPSPAAALVRPRVISPDTGDIVPLVDELAIVAERRDHGTIALLGSQGSGKSVALAYLRSIVGEQSGLLLLDEPEPALVDHCASNQLVVYSAAVRSAPRGEECLRLADWGEDELIEYLLAAHPRQCASVIARLRSAADRRAIGSATELWPLVLERMAADEDIVDITAALRRELRTRLATPRLRRVVGRYCLDTLAGLSSVDDWAVQELQALHLADDTRRLLRHEVVQLLAAENHLARALRIGAGRDFLIRSLPQALLRRIGARVARRAALRKQFDALAQEKACQPMAASILHMAGGWKPAPGQPMHLAGAYLDHAQWQGVDLCAADLTAADFSHADLREAKLGHAKLDLARLEHACLADASLVNVSAKGVELAHADLSRAAAPGTCFRDADLRYANLDAARLWNATFMHANLSYARLRGADLTNALLVGAEIEDADFSGANLRGAYLSQLKLSVARFEGANFVSARLQRSDLEFMRLPGADFTRANLTGALLTGSMMPGGKFLNARLCQAGLADVQWENADLRHADLRGATFHLGSSRSGLLFTPIASEGTRTGFYTDDYGEQYFKSPEEIRKANLCGADLRDARIEGVDFYLVDLRGALYSAAQREHLCRCRAILDG